MKENKDIANAGVGTSFEGKFVDTKTHPCFSIMDNFSFDKTAELVKLHRKSTGLNQKDYSAKAGIPLRTFANIESGKKVDFDTAKKALKYAGYSIKITKDTLP